MGPKTCHFLEGIYCLYRGVVLFAVFPMGGTGSRILADISEEELADVFKVRGGGSSWVQGCGTYFSIIEAAAIKKWTSSPNTQVRLEAPDFLVS